MDNTARTLSYIQAKPILKWAGGKTQMLNDLLPKVPSSYARRKIRGNSKNPAIYSRI